MSQIISPESIRPISVADLPTPAYESFLRRANLYGKDRGTVESLDKFHNFLHLSNEDGSNIFFGQHNSDIDDVMTSRVEVVDLDKNGEYFGEAEFCVPIKGRKRVPDILKEPFVYILKSKSVSSDELSEELFSDKRRLLAMNAASKLLYEMTIWSDSVGSDGEESLAWSELVKEGLASTQIVPMGKDKISIFRFLN